VLEQVGRRADDGVRTLEHAPHERSVEAHQPFLTREIAVVRDHQPVLAGLPAREVARRSLRVVHVEVQDVVLSCRELEREARRRFRRGEATKRRAASDRDTVDHVTHRAGLRVRDDDIQIDPAL
jgi:hypothetical protein